MGVSIRNADRCASIRKGGIGRWDWRKEGGILADSLMGGLRGRQHTGANGVRLEAK